MATTRQPGTLGSHIPIVSADDVRPGAAGAPGALAAAPSTVSRAGDTPGPSGTNGDTGWSLANLGHPFGLNLGAWADRLSLRLHGKDGEFEIFKAKVLAEEIAMRTRRGLRQLEAVPEDELVVVEGDKRMRKDAAAKLRLLLAKARGDLKEAQDAFRRSSSASQDAARTIAAARGEVVVVDVKQIWVQSAYRDFKYDEHLWHDYFKTKYYPKTKHARAQLAGGEHGDAAVRYLAKYISGKKAPPGFSNHSDGRAVDFGTLEGTTRLVGDVELNPRWLKSWLHKWLVAHAAEYGFKPLATEAWHWDFHK